MDKEKQHFKKGLKEDKLQSFAAKVIMFFEDTENKKRVLNWITYALIIGVIVFMYSQSRNQVNKQAEPKFMAAVRNLYDGETDDAIKGFKYILENYPSSKYKAETLYYLGECNYKKKNYDETIKNMSEALKKSLPKIFKPAAYISLAYCYEEKGDLNKAVSTYEEMNKEIPDYYAKDMILINMARCLKALGKNSEAKEKYLEVVNRYSGSTWAALAKENLER